MKAEDYLKLPERIDNIIKVKLSKTAMDKYKQLEKDLPLPLKDSDIVANNAAVFTNKLLQMANGSVYDENGDIQEIHDEKIKALEAIIEATNRKQVLIFYSYKHDRDRLPKHFKVKELKTSNEVVKRMNKENREEIYKMIKATEFEVTRLNYCIDRLEPQIRDAVKQIFIEKCSWNEACTRCSISEKTLNKYKNKCIDEITLMFDLGETSELITGLFIFKHIHRVKINLESLRST